MKAESFLIILTIVASLTLIISGALIAELNPTIGIVLCSLGSLIVFLGVAYGVKLEHDVGYYECPECKTRYVPSMKSVVMAVHYGTTRKMRCPHCNKKGYHKKVMTK